VPTAGRNARRQGPRPWCASPRAPARFGDGDDLVEARPGGGLGAGHLVQQGQPGNAAPAGLLIGPGPTRRRRRPGPSAVVMPSSAAQLAGEVEVHHVAAVVAVRGTAPPWPASTALVTSRISSALGEATTRWPDRHGRHTSPSPDVAEETAAGCPGPRPPVTMATLPATGASARTQGRGPSPARRQLARVSGQDARQHCRQTKACGSLSIFLHPPTGCQLLPKTGKNLALTVVERMTWPATLPPLQCYQWTAS